MSGMGISGKSKFNTASPTEAAQLHKGWNDKHLSLTFGFPKAFSSQADEIGDFISVLQDNQTNPKVVKILA